MRESLLAAKGTRPTQVFVYQFDFCKAHSPDSQESADLKAYLTQLGEANNNHVSVLVNNVATPMAEFTKLDAHEMTRTTNNKIDNHTLITEVLMKEIRDRGLKQFTGGDSFRSAVINVGLLEDNLVEEKLRFKSKQEEADFDVYRATSIYQTQMASLRVHKSATAVDFVVDSPENCNIFRQNLKYLGIEVTPGSHVDQVVKSLILNYQDREA